MSNKKTLALLSAMIMTLSLVGCGGNSSTNNETETSASSQSAANSESTSAEDNTAVAEPDSETIEETNEITFEEITVADNEECAIKITGIDPDNIWGFTLTTELENKSEDKTYMFSVESASINGVQCDPFWASEIVAGKKSNEEISFSSLEEYGIIEYTDIELTFRVYDSDDWTADDVINETVHVYPYGEDKAVAFIRESQDSDNVIIDNEYVTVTVIGYEVDDIWGYTVNLYLENKTESTIMFSVDDASINGYMADPFYAESVSAGKSAFSSISWYNSTLEENGIAEVEEIEMVFRAYDYDNWTGDDLANEVITLIP